MTAAIYFHPEAYTTAGPKLMGRNAAGESFLRGYLTHSTALSFWAQLANPHHQSAFVEAVQSCGRTEPVHLVNRTNLAALAQAGTVYHPGPGIGEQALQRAAFGHGAWSLCGITHTTSSAGAMDAIAEWLTAPVQPWDAVICTSTAVKGHVEQLLNAQLRYLQDRLGIQRAVLPQLPVIPLGIHTADFRFDAAQRATARQRLGADSEALVVLFMGRLSFHAKAHPLAMYQALEQSAQRTGKTVWLVECGWHANEPIRNAYATAATLACPSVRVMTLDGRDAASRQIAWASADVFCSLSDNIQETFGIVPLEAMAAGLPVVVSDWNGYRDTVREGVEGFRIPTAMPGPGLGTDLALRHALEIDTYDMYCGHTCSLVAVDVEAAADALSQLFRSAELRQRMGAAGRARATAVYDWSAIIPQYEGLWQDLAARRAQSGLPPGAPAPWPARLDPFAGFVGYPTHLLSLDTRLRLVGGSAVAANDRLKAYRQLAMVNFAQYVLPTVEESITVFDALDSGTRSANQLVDAIPAERRGPVLRGLVNLMKLGLIGIDRDKA
jgi:glycosyltransferase involved in cell wall biosynthesis